MIKEYKDGFSGCQGKYRLIDYFIKHISHFFLLLKMSNFPESAFSKICAKKDKVRTSNEYKLFDKVNHTNQRTPKISYNDICGMGVRHSNSIKVAISYLKIDEKGIEFFPQTQIFSSLIHHKPCIFLLWWCVNLWYFKLRFFDLREFIVRNIYDIRLQTYRV